MYTVCATRKYVFCFFPFPSHPTYDSSIPDPHPIVPFPFPSICRFLLQFDWHTDRLMDGWTLVALQHDDDLREINCTWPDRYLRSLPFHCRNLSCLTSSLSWLNHSSLDRGGLMYGSCVSSPINNTYTHMHMQTHISLLIITFILLNQTQNTISKCDAYGHVTKIQSLAMT